MEAKFNWNTGYPTESCDCIVTMDDGTVTIKSFYRNPVTDCSYWHIKDYETVIAWCKIGDIEPYNVFNV